MKNIDNTSVESLSMLADGTSQLIYSGRVMTSYGATELEASEFSIKLDEETCVCISSCWYECEETGLDYPIVTAKKHTFEVSPNTSIFSFENKSKYTPVKLLSVAHEDDSSLIYEGAILLSRLDGKSVVIFGGESAFRNLVLEHRKEQIENYLEKVISIREC